MVSIFGDMIARFVDALVRGSAAAWLCTGGLWLLTAGVVLAHRRGARSSGIRVLSLLSLTSVAAFAGLCVATAVAIPRLRWATSAADPLVIPSGDTWRLLRGPAVVVDDGADVELAVPTIDGSGRWTLVGLISGRAIAGFEEAKDTPPTAGSPRICATEGEACRAWPASWPTPIQSASTLALSWTERGDPLSALAFDVESGQYLRSLSQPSGDPRGLEILGRVSNDPPRDTFSALFVLRRLVAGRLQAARVVSAPSGESYTFQIQRSDVSLAAGPLALRLVARPVLAALAFAFPLGLIAYLLSPTLILIWTRRRDAALSEAGRAAVRARLTELLRPLALSAAGAAIAVPGLVAIASLLGAR